MEEENSEEDYEADERISNEQKVEEIRNSFEKLIEKQNFQLDRLNKNMDLMVTLLGEISGNLDRNS